MSIVERIKAVEAVLSAYNRTSSPARAIEHMEVALTAIAAALAEAEKVDERNKWLEGANAMLLRPTTNYCEVCAKRDAAFQRAREAWRGVASGGWRNSVLDEFFGGGEGEG